MLRSIVRGVGAYLPARTVTNAELSERLETSDSWIRERTGIRERHIAAEGEVTSDLATAAARAALKRADIDPSTIDLVLVATSTPDLTFPATDVNDLIKSLVLEDTGGGKVATINYDSQDPIERTLKTFALDLTANPSLGQLLNQARGEKVEVTLQSGAAGQAGTLSGAILGMESQKQPQGKDAMIDVDILNLVCAEGLRSVPLKDVVACHAFCMDVIDDEFGQH